MKYNTAKIVEKKTLKENTINIYVGWDSREPIAADVLRYSIEQNTSVPVNIIYLKQEELREQGLYWRDVDPLSSTEFTFTRFLVPYLNNYEGFAIFVDCDFLAVNDLAELINQADKRKAVQVVQHDYTPPEGIKMDGQRQLPYPRKNWSSMILWNCGHKDNKIVDLEFVNTATGQELHRFTWLRDSQIGNLSPEWNWLAGWYREIRDGHPKFIHYTEGGPWFDEWQHVEYADLWCDYRDRLKDMQQDRQVVAVKDLTLNSELKQHIHNIVTGMLDPNKIVYDHYAQDSIDWFNRVRLPKCVGLLDVETENGEIVLKEDPVMDNFLLGSGGQVGTGKGIVKMPVEVPAVIRGIAKKKLIHNCIDTGRDYYYIDTGYFGNDKRKTYHRVTKNNMQYLGELDPDCPDDRFVRTGMSLTKFRPGTNILICPPSEKAMSYWDLDLQTWLDETIATIKKHSDRPIVIREKQPRRVRTNNDTIAMALSRDVHCMVTFNSIAAVESLIYGKPVFTMGPNAAEPLANTDLTKIEKPYIPTIDEVRNLCCNLAYNQFTIKEMRDGLAWQLLNEV